MEWRERWDIGVVVQRVKGMVGWWNSGMMKCWVMGGRVIELLEIDFRF